jgi:hypothetical protein
MGVFSPILRPHCAGRGGNQRDIWRFDYPAFEVMRDYFRLRARLVPYLATAQRLAYETGVVPVHPLYYDFPDSLLAYDETALHQHAFGDDIWVAPIASPARDPSGLAQVAIWFPPGHWIEWFSWQAHSVSDTSGAVFERRFALSEVPVYSRAGAIIPLRTLPASGPRTGEGDVVGTAVDVPAAMTLWIFPPPPGSLNAGPVTFGARLYDDDGVSMAYASAEAFRWTNVSCTWSRSAVIQVDQSRLSGAAMDKGSALLSASSIDSVACNIAPGGGGKGFVEMPASRAWTLRFISTWPPASVMVGGLVAVPHPAAVPDSWGDHGAWPTDGLPAWAYAGGQVTTWVQTGMPSSVDDTLTVRVTFPHGMQADDRILTSAIARKISRAQAAKRLLNTLGEVGASDAPNILRVAGLGAVVEEAVADAQAVGLFSSDITAATGVAGVLSAVRSKYAQIGDTLVAALEEAARLRHRGARGPVIDAVEALLRNALE